MNLHSTRISEQRGLAQGSPLTESEWFFRTRGRVARATRALAFHGLIPALVEHGCSRRNAHEVGERAAMGNLGMVRVGVRRFFHIQRDGADCGAAQSAGGDYDR